jgi:Flp pilus assembly protein TadD
MKKTTLTLLISGLLFITGIRAQSIQEGINHLYADRDNSAIDVFQKLLAANPNNIEAIYWLGQTYLEMDEIAGARAAAARQLYEKALQTSANAPLILVGMGHVELRENKPADARQRFEAALTMTRTKKGDDPAILTAIGRANVDAKTGDLAYAIEKLEAAVLRDPKNAEIYLQLGNAYRKAKPGEGGGLAYTNYQKALEVNPNFPVADLRLAKLFESQKNWEFFLQYLNDAIKIDPKFTPAYYELFYYNFFRAKFPEAEDQLKKYIDSKLPEKDIQDEYLYAQLCWARKDFDCAITKAGSVVTAKGDLTKPKVYRLMADAYFQKGDTLNKKGDSVNAKVSFISAKKYSDLFFLKKNPEDVILPDYETRAAILSGLNASPDDVYNTYISGATVDTTIEAKVDYLKKGADYFKTKGDSTSRNKEGDVRLAIIKLKPSPSQRDIFDAGFAYYQGKSYTRSDSLATIYTQKWADETFGWFLKFNSQKAIDTSMTLGLAVPTGIQYLVVLEKDTAKNKKAIIGVAGYLAQYYANVAKDKEKAIIYLEKLVQLDPTNDNFKKYLEDMKRPAPRTTTAPRGNAPPKPAPLIKAKSGMTAETAVLKT